MSDPFSDYPASWRALTQAMQTLDRAAEDPSLDEGELIVLNRMSAKIEAARMLLMHHLLLRDDAERGKARGDPGEPGAG